MLQRGGLINISIAQSILPISYAIANANGVVVYKGHITSDKQQVDILSLLKGVYFIRCYLNEKINTKKIVLI